VNTTAQGHPVPVGYGRMIVGSAVISAGIDVDEIPVDEISV
jgi:predicted phage tail protein